MDKGPEAFRTISEVADDLDLPQHVLRFWETRFPQIKPLKRGGGRRYYRPDDISLLRGIRHLLYGEGYTIKGVQRILREQGPRHVMAMWQEADDGDPEQDTAPLPSGPELFAPSKAASQNLGPEAPHRMVPQVAAPVPPGQHAPHPAQQGIPLASGMRLTPVVQPVDAPPHVAERAPAAEPVALGLGREDVRRLQATLYELMECKRLLERAR